MTLPEVRTKMSLIVVQISECYTLYRTAGKFATAVQKYCWRLNTKCN